MAFLDECETVEARRRVEEAARRQRRSRRRYLVAATVRFLCSPAARYINGQAIHANGGAYLGS